MKKNISERTKTIKCKECGKENAKDSRFCQYCGNHLKDGIIGFFIAFLFLYLAVEIVSAFLPSIIVSSITYYKYGQELLYEALLVLVVLIVMLLSRNSYVFTQKRESLFKSLLVGWPFLLIAFISLFFSVVSIEKFEFFNFLNLLLFCLTIGMYEEFLCRGWIQNEFIERYGKTKRQIIRSIILASLIFGGMHIINVFAGQTLFETIMQIIQATAAGIFLGSVYYKTKNIWSVIILHGFFDFSLMLADHALIRECTTGTATTAIMADSIIGSLIISAFYIVGAIIVLKKCNFNETIIIGNKKDKDSKSESKVSADKSSEKNKKGSAKLVIVAIVLLIVSFLPFSFASDEEYEKYYTCYSYELKTIDDHEIRNFYTENFELNHIKETTKVVEVPTDQVNADGSIVMTKKEEVTKEEFKFKIYLDTESYDSVLENTTTGDKIVLDDTIEDISKIVVIENTDNYIIGIMAADDIYNKVYYTKLNKNDINNSKEYLESIVNSFKSYDLPYLEDIGSIKLAEANDEALYMISTVKDEFMIDEKDDLYQIRQKGLFE